MSWEALDLKASDAAATAARIDACCCPAAAAVAAAGAAAVAAVAGAAVTTVVAPCRGRRCTLAALTEAVVTAAGTQLSRQAQLLRVFPLHRLVALDVLCCDLVA